MVMSMHVRAPRQPAQPPLPATGAAAACDATTEACCRQSAVCWMSWGATVRCCGCACAPVRALICCPGERWAPKCCSSSEKSMPRIQLRQWPQQADLLYHKILAKSSLLSRQSPLLRQAAPLCPAILAHRAAGRHCGSHG